MLRATVLLCLVASAVLTQSLAAAQYNGPTDDTIATDSSQLRDSSTNGKWSAVPKCAADYPRMSVADRKVFQNGSPSPQAVCIRADGYFVAAVLRSNLKFVFMFDTCGWIKKKIMLPSRSGDATGCAFTSTKFYYALYTDRKILQFSIDGKYEKVFATGFQFLRLTTYNDSLLYSSIYSTKKVRAYDTTTGNLKYTFETSTGQARGLAFDPAGYLHVSTWSKVVDKFTYQGFKIGEKSYPDVYIADGILIDSNYYILIANRYRNEVLIYTQAGLLTKKITGFSQPLDLVMGYKCGYLIVADIGRNGVYLL